jgi:membrane associated rhomboid family serine protease
MKLSDLLLKKKLGIPWITLLLFINCTLVSVSCTLFTRLYEVFAARPPKVYPWVVITTVLVHGWTGMGIVIHLGANMVLLLTLGIPLERLMGPSRTFLLLVCGGFLFMCLAALGGGIGASWLIWPLGPVALVILYNYRKKTGKDVWKDPIFLVMLYALFLMWVFSVYFFGFIIFFTGREWTGSIMIRILVGILAGVLWHLFPTIVGIIFAVVWRKKIRTRMDLLWNDKENRINNRWRVDKVVMGGMVGLLVFNVLLLMLAAVGVV